MLLTLAHCLLLCSSHQRPKLGKQVQQTRQTVRNNCCRGSYNDDLCLSLSRAKYLQQPSNQDVRGVSSSLNDLLAYSWPTTHKLGCSLYCFRVLGQPPVTMGKVIGPRLSSLVQRARKEEAAGPAGLRAWQRTGTKSYQCTSQARGYYQANGRAICHNWYRSLKETPLALPLKSQGLAGQILFQLEAANLIKG